MTTVQFKDHPVLKDILNYQTSDQAQAQIAFVVYMQLCEDKSWLNVKTHCCEELSMVFLSGHASKTKPREVILPISVDTTFSQADLDKYMDKIKLPDYQTNGLILAICGRDGSTVFYKLTDGLVPPDHPDITDWKKYRHEEMPDLRRHHVAEQTALYIHQLQQKTVLQKTADSSKNDSSKNDSSKNDSSKTVTSSESGVK